MKTSNETKTILSAIEQICHEKNLSKERVLEAIEQALASAFRKDFGNKQQNLKVNFDPETGQIEVFDEKIVVEDVSEEELEIKGAEEKKEKEELSPDEIEKKRFNPKTEIQISEAKKIKKGAKIDDVIQQKLEIPSDFGRIAAQTAKQVIIQRLREAERDTIYEKYKELEGSVVNGVVQREERRALLVDLGETTALLPLGEQIRQERYRPEQKIKVYILSVDKTSKGPEIIVSRRHLDILKELFKMEIPEIANGAVEIKNIAREAGARSKVAVWTKEESIDPIGACIGQRGVRIQTIINEIGGEKIDIIEYDENLEKFIANALAPAKVSSIKLDEKGNCALVKVKKEQFSLAIGKDGQNVRLAAKLTGKRIDVKLDEEEEKSEEIEQEKTKKKNKKEEKEEEGEEGDKKQPEKEKKESKKQKKEKTKKKNKKEEKEEIEKVENKKEKKQKG